MSGLFSSPKAPDPYQTAAAQAQANSDAARVTAQYNMVDQITPYGNLTYSQNGTYADGTPKYTATQTLNPTQTQTLANQDTLSKNLSNIGLSYTGQFQNLADNPFSLSGLGVSAPTGDQQYIDSATDALYGQYKSRLDNDFGQQERNLETKLTNQGISPGTEAWDQAMKNFSFARNDANQSALNQAVANGETAASNRFNMQNNAFNTALNTALTVRNQPINELAALLGNSSGVQNPNLTNTPTVNVAPSDISGLIQNNYNTQVGQKNAQLGAIAALGGAATSAALARR